MIKWVRERVTWRDATLLKLYMRKTQQVSQDNNDKKLFWMGFLNHNLSGMVQDVIDGIEKVYMYV